MNTLTILGQSGREHIPAEEILYLQADINYTMIHLLSKTKRIVSFTLRKVEERITGNDFIRINRGLSINRSHLQKVNSLDNKLFVTLSNGQVLPVSRRKSVFVKRCLVIV
jgi:two-component system, LytTR family, response regulator